MAGEPLSVSNEPEYPEARLRPMTDEERARHPWYKSSDVPLVAVCGATEGCDGWLAAVQADSAGTLRNLLLAGTHRHGQLHMWWAKRPPRRQAREEVLWYRSIRMSQVPLSGRPGRVKIQCPECWRFSKIVAPRPQPRRAKPASSAE